MARSSCISDRAAVGSARLGFCLDFNCCNIYLNYFENLAIACRRIISREPFLVIFINCNNFVIIPQFYENMRFPPNIRLALSLIPFYTVDDDC